MHVLQLYQTIDPYVCMDFCSTIACIFPLCLLFAVCARMEWIFILSNVCTVFTFQLDASR